MSIQATIYCSVCNKLKGDNDKRWLVGMQVSIPIVSTPLMYTIIRWDMEIALRPKADHMCSDKCAQAILTGWLRELHDRGADELDDLPATLKKMEPLLN